MNLTEIANKVEIGLLEKLSSGDIIDYSIDIIHDDKRIDIVMRKPTKALNITLGIRNGTQSQ